MGCGGGGRAELIPRGGMGRSQALGRGHFRLEAIAEKDGAGQGSSKDGVS